MRRVFRFRHWSVCEDKTCKTKLHHFLLEYFQYPPIFSLMGIDNWAGFFVGWPYRKINLDRLSVFFEGHFCFYCLWNNFPLWFRRYIQHVKFSVKEFTAERVSIKCIYSWLYHLVEHELHSDLPLSELPLFAWALDQPLFGYLRRLTCMKLKALFKNDGIL